MASTTGTRFDRYEMLAPLGAGGMAQVSLARDMRLSRTVVLKFLLAELQTIAQQKYLPAYKFAIVYASLGDHTQAFQELRKSYQARAARRPSRQVDPCHDNLRADPCCADLVRAVGR